MNRKEFIKKGVLSSVLLSASYSGFNAEDNENKLSYNRVGYNHLPNEEIKTMKTVLHKANSRGFADHGWLKARHSFSFANYHNPERMHFGVLRVLNDDCIDGGKGFSTHPHDNMEIITIPLEGDLEHKDSMGNKGVIKNGEIQVMSAGKGIYHSEYNHNKNIPVKLLQIWLFPNKKDVNPRYDQIKIDNLMIPNKFNQVLSPDVSDAGVWIHQNAWFHIGFFDKGGSYKYELRDPKNGLYVFIIDGKVNIQEQDLDSRDGFGLWDTSEVSIDINSSAKLLLMEVPMQV